MKTTNRYVGMCHMKLSLMIHYQDIFSRVLSFALLDNLITLNFKVHKKISRQYLQIRTAMQEYQHCIIASRVLVYVYILYMYI